MRVLCVTSFAADMLPSGLRLIESVGRRSELDLLICHEGLDASCLEGSTRRLRYDIGQSPFLRGWLRANADLIPRELGGTTGACDCGAASPFQGHREGCHWFWFNRNAARWFRKVVALDHARTIAPYDILLWLDADCRLRRRLGSMQVAEWIGTSSVFFLKSPDRRVMESGVLGIRMDGHGKRFISLTADRFRSGAFKRYPRWDDGYHFQVTLDENPDIPAVDLATTVTGGTFVVPNSPVGRYISHDKGLHRRLAIMC